MKNKPITEISTEELENLLEKEESSDTIIDYPNDIMQFLSAYQLKTGTYSVPQKVLHKLYRLWSKNPLDQRSFTSHMNNFIESRSNKYYCLNINTQTILKKTLKYFEKADKTKSKLFQKHFETYLKKYNITAGTLAIKSIVLFNLYDKWIHSFRKNYPLGYDQFNNFCKLYFESTIIRRHLWIYVDKSIQQHLTKELIELLNHRTKRSVKKENKKK